MGVQENSGVIYTITNMVNGKIYVGQSWNMYWRRLQHLQARGTAPLANAIRKYGRDAFVFTVVESGIQNQSTLDYLECKWISVCCSSRRGVGYNLREGGSRGKHAEDTKAILSARAMGRPSAFKGHSHTEETKAVLRATRLGRTGTRLGHKNSPEANAKIRAYRLGRPLPKSVKEKISASSRGKLKSAETRARMSAAATGRIYSSASIAAMSRGAKNRVVERERGSDGRYV